MTGQEDFVLVPKVPDQRFLERFMGHGLDCQEPDRPDSWLSIARKKWLDLISASPQPQGAACKICKGSGMTGWEKPMGNPPTIVFVPQLCRCEAGQKLFNSTPPHPQPSGDGLSEETLREMIKDGYEAEADYIGYDTFIEFARAVEARVRSTPTPTDEWRRAVEACAGVLERLSGEETISRATALFEAAAEIRALSPTKPDDGWRTMESAPTSGNMLGFSWKWGVAEIIRFDSGNFGLATFNGQIQEAHPCLWRPLPAPPHTKEGE